MDQKLALLLLLSTLITILAIYVPIVKCVKCGKRTHLKQHKDGNLYCKKCGYNYGYYKE
jgi:ribosomal protein L37AE/L43A